MLLLLLLQRQECRRLAAVAAAAAIAAAVAAGAAAGSACQEGVLGRGCLLQHRLAQPPLHRTPVGSPHLGDALEPLRGRHPLRLTTSRPRVGTHKREGLLPQRLLELWQHRLLLLLRRRRQVLLLLVLVLLLVGPLV